MHLPLFILLLLSACATYPQQPPANLADPAYQSTIKAIQTKVNKNWLYLSNAKISGLSVTVLVKLNEKGEVIEDVVTHSSGNPGFDASLHRAIRKSSPLPIPPSQSHLFRSFDLVFQQ